MVLLVFWLLEKVFLADVGERESEVEDVEDVMWRNPKACALI